MKNVFRTRRGIYALDEKSGLYSLVNGVSTPKRFLGSVDPNIKLDAYPQFTLEEIRAGYRADAYFSGIIQNNGFAKGFTPNFVVEFRPFGIVCDLSDIEKIGEEEIEFSQRLLEQIKNGNKIFYELGSKIEQVY